MKVLAFLIISQLFILNCFGDELRTEASEDEFWAGAIMAYGAHGGVGFASEAIANNGVVRYAKWIETSLRRDKSIANANKHLELMKTQVRKGKLTRLAFRSLFRSIALLGAFTMGYEVGLYLNDKTSVGKYVGIAGDKSGLFSLIFKSEQKFHELVEYLNFTSQELVETYGDEVDIADYGL